jgi:DNA-binding transcriptional ArsR family regulator
MSNRSESIREDHLLAGEMAEMLGVLAHRDRLRLLGELAGGERDVGGLGRVLGLPRVGVSQHLALLRARHLVTAVRRGQHVIYRLADPAIARWIHEGIGVLLAGPAQQALRRAVEEAANESARSNDGE